MIKDIEARLEAIQYVDEDANADFIANAPADIRFLLAEVERKDEALRTYGHHTDDCVYGMENSHYVGKDILCTCGLEEALEEMKESRYHTNKRSCD